MPQAKRTAQRTAHRTSSLLFSALLILTTNTSARAQFSGPALTAPTTDRAALLPTAASELLHFDHGDIHLETLNYSEIGMLLWSFEEQDRSTQMLEQGETVNGTVGDAWQVPFTARVVHSRKQSDGWQYGLAVELQG